MKKKLIRKWMMGRMMLICLACLICVPTSMAQGSASDKIEQAKRLFSIQLSTSSNEQRNGIINFYNQCSEQQKEAILTYMVRAITDSLKAENKQFAMNYIDCYRLIATPYNEYLGSLIVTEAKYYYDLTDAQKLSELSDYITGIAAKSELDYSAEVAELNTMRDNLLKGCNNMLGYWCVDDSISNEPPLYLKVEKINNQLIVSLSMPMFSFNTYNILRDPEVMEKNNKLMEEFRNKNSTKMRDLEMLNREQEKIGIVMKEYFIFKGDLSSSECIQSSPNSLSFFWASQKIKKGKEYLATGLRSGVRTISNDILGELARSNTHSFGTTLFGSLGTIFGEAVLNGLIDGISTSKNTIRTISATLTLSGKNTMEAEMYVDYFHATTEESKVEVDSCECKVKLMRYDLSDPYISENIAFYDYFSGLKPKLRQYKDLSSKETKQYLSRHPEAKIKGSSLSEAFWEKIMNYNKEQYAKLREYVRTH